MDKPISVGDLVIVVRESCCASHCGLIYRVTEISPPQPCECSECGADAPASEPFIENDDWSFFPSELKRIPPLSELESEKRDEKLTEPA